MSSGHAYSSCGTEVMRELGLESVCVALLEPM